MEDTSCMRENWDGFPPRRLMLMEEEEWVFWSSSRPFGKVCHAPAQSCVNCL